MRRRLFIVLMLSLLGARALKAQDDANYRRAAWAKGSLPTEIRRIIGAPAARKRGEGNHTTAVREAPQASPRPRRSAGTQLAFALYAAGGLLIVLGVAALLRRRRRSGARPEKPSRAAPTARSAEEPISRGDTLEGLRALHRDGLASLRRLGLIGEPPTPPDGRILAKLAQTPALEPFRSLSQVFAKLRYGGQETTPEEQSAALEGARRLGELAAETTEGPRS